MWVVTNGSTAFSGSVQSYEGSSAYSNTLDLQAGAYIDFIVAWNGGTDNQYNWTLVNATITSQATRIVTWTNPAPITYGTPLSSNQLDATANVPGNFSFIPPAGTTLNAGTNTITTVFTPTNSLDYGSVTDTVRLVVLPAPLAVTANNATRPYGQPNPLFSGSIAGLCNGDNITVEYSCSATNTSPPGTYAIVPSLVDPYGRLNNYQVSLTNGTLTITTGPLPDLQVLSVSGPQQAWTGQAFDATFILTNGGAGAAVGPWVDQVYLSATNQLSYQL